MRVEQGRALDASVAMVLDRDASAVDLVYICHGVPGEGCGRMVLADA